LKAALSGLAAAAAIPVPSLPALGPVRRGNFSAGGVKHE